MLQLGRHHRLTVGIELWTAAEHAERFAQLFRSLTVAVDGVEQLGALEVLVNPGGRAPREGAFEVSFELHHSDEKLADQALFSRLEVGGWPDAEQLTEQLNEQLRAATVGRPGEAAQAVAKGPRTALAGARRFVYGVVRTEERGSGGEGGGKGGGDSSLKRDSCRA